MCGISEDFQQTVHLTRLCLQTLDWQHYVVLCKLAARGAVNYGVCCAASADALRQEVMQSSWYDQFRADVRSSVVVRAVEGSLSRVAAATAATASGTWAVTSWTTARIASASRNLRCYKHVYKLGPLSSLPADVFEATCTCAYTLTMH